jgi:uncharacterized protein (DUF433 family)
MNERPKPRARPIAWLHRLVPRHGKLHIRSTDVPAALVRKMLLAGSTVAEVLKSHPALKPADIAAVLTHYRPRQTVPSAPRLKATHFTDEIDSAVRRATFHRARSGWCCRAYGFEAVGLGKTKSEAQTNLRGLLSLTGASGVAVAKTRREVGPPRASWKPRTESKS